MSYDFSNLEISKSFKTHRVTFTSNIEYSNVNIIAVCYNTKLVCLIKAGIQVLKQENIIHIANLSKSLAFVVGLVTILIVLFL